MNNRPLVVSDDWAAAAWLVQKHGIDLYDCIGKNIGKLLNTDPTGNYYMHDPEAYRFAQHVELGGLPPEILTDLMKCRPDLAHKCVPQPATDDEIIDFMEEDDVNALIIMERLGLKASPRVAHCALRIDAHVIEFIWDGATVAERAYAVAKLGDYLDDKMRGSLSALETQILEIAKDEVII